MLKKLILHLWSMRLQFIRYFVIGCSAVVLDIGSLYALKQWANLRPVIAVVINQIFILNWVFFLNRSWSFKAKGAAHAQAVRFLIVAGFNYTVSIGWMFLFNEKLGVNYLLARTVNIAIAVAWNFFLYRYFVYRQPQAAADVATPQA